LKPPIAAGSGESGSRHHSEGEVKARLTIGGSHRFDRFCQPDPEVFLQQTGRIMSGETLYIPAATQQVQRSRVNPSEQPPMIIASFRTMPDRASLIGTTAISDRTP
jgi:hypothetical protein